MNVRRTRESRKKLIMDYLKGRPDHPPTLREIGKACDISSASMVSGLVRELEDEGLVDYEGNKSRGIRLAGHVPEIDRLRARVEELERQLHNLQGVVS